MASPQPELLASEIPENLFDFVADDAQLTAQYKEVEAQVLANIPSDSSQGHYDDLRVVLLCGALTLTYSNIIGQAWHRDGVPGRKGSGTFYRRDPESHQTRFSAGGTFELKISDREAVLTLRDSNSGVVFGPANFDGFQKGLPMDGECTGFWRVRRVSEHVADDQV